MITSSIESVRSLEFLLSLKNKVFFFFVLFVFLLVSSFFCFFSLVEKNKKRLKKNKKNKRNTLTEDVDTNRTKKNKF